ncbi:integrase core domain-containing protein [Sphingobacterium siyangense]
MDLYRHIKEYVSFYNTERRHKSLGRITPDEKFCKEIKNVS